MAVNYAKKERAVERYCLGTEISPRLEGANWWLKNVQGKREEDIAATEKLAMELMAPEMETAQPKKKGGKEKEKGGKGKKKGGKGRKKCLLTQGVRHDDGHRETHWIM